MSPALPPPPPNKAGWPWTESAPQTSNSMPYGREWPRISIVTPSYNQGQFLEETIRSVLLQGYPNLEYIIMDGGSSDNSVDIIKEYEPWLTYWASERDKGQVDALNRGFEKCSGEIFAYINSDDHYYENTFFTIATLFAAQKSYDFVSGACCYISYENSTNKPNTHTLPQHIVKPSISVSRPEWFLKYKISKYSPLIIPQPSTFWRKSAHQELDCFDTNLTYCFDREYWMRALFNNKKFYIVNDIFSMFRIHVNSKSSVHLKQFDFENSIINEKYRVYLNIKECEKLIKLIKRSDFQEYFWCEKKQCVSTIDFISLFNKYIIHSCFRVYDNEYWNNVLSIIKALILRTYTKLKSIHW